MMQMMFKNSVITEWDNVYKNHGEPGDTSADDVVRVHEEINSHGDDEGAEEDRGEIF